MAVLAAILWGLLALLVLLVGVPFHAEATGSVHEASPDAQAELRWGWGFVSLRISRKGPALSVLGLRVWRFSSRGRRREEEKKDAAEKAEGHASRGRRILRALLEHRRALMSMALRFARVLRLRLCVKGTIGTGDPADTALLSSAARLFEGLPGVKLGLQWDWVEEELEIDVEGRARIWIGHLLFEALALLMIRENRAVLRAVT
jgi:hypothetical protein